MLFFRLTGSALAPPQNGRIRSAAPYCVSAAITVALVVSAALPSAGAQQPLPSAGPPVASYRPPALALVQPASGGSVPQDRPIVVFRFAAGDSTDPVDARSFAATVDGTDRSALFQVARDEAWGPLAPQPNDRQLPVALGTHQLAARICSIRGACTEVNATVTVAASAAVPADKSAGDRKRTLLDLLLTAVRKLLNP
jgi:hypothetical protein